MKLLIDAYRTLQALKDVCRVAAGALEVVSWAMCQEVCPLLQSPLHRWQAQEGCCGGLINSRVTAPSSCPWPCRSYPCSVRVRWHYWALRKDFDCP
eukprot:365079-Chlamydomonas_euryale.AAC.3